MIVTINGKKREIDTGSLPDLLQSLELDPSGIILELNREIIPRDRFGSIALQDGDTLELIRVVGGG